MAFCHTTAVIHHHLLSNQLNGPILPDDVHLIASDQAVHVVATKAYAEFYPS